MGQCVTLLTFFQLVINVHAVYGHSESMFIYSPHKKHGVTSCFSAKRNVASSINYIFGQQVAALKPQDYVSVKGSHTRGLPLFRLNVFRDYSISLPFSHRHSSKNMFVLKRLFIPDV